MRTKPTLLFALLVVGALAVVLALFPGGSAAAPAPLTSLNGTHSGPRASETVVPNDRPTIFKLDQTRTVNPSQLPAGGSATFSTKIRINPYAANWTTQGNLLAVGLLRQITGETPDGNTPFLVASPFGP